MKNFVVLVSWLVAAYTGYAAALTCKCFPGDTCWPSTAEWNQLNETVDGRLIETVPIGSPCHAPNYNATECKYLQKEWRNEVLHLNSSSSVMQPFFANNSCDPFQPVATPCKLGNYVRYTVNATSVADIQAAVNFAKEKNIRFVIRNTGHDYLGRSTGAGSLSVWTHHLKDIEILDYKSADYTGKAVKVGAGVEGFDVLEATRDKGLVVVGGECPSVGLAGGYTQGGGHSVLSTKFGLAADNTLEWEVVLANGSFVTASRTENEDLYYALSGGGGSTYGVVTSMTVKAHPDAPIGAAFMVILAGKEDNATDTFFEMIQAFHEELPAMIDAGAMVVYTFSASYFIMMPLTGYNMTKVEVEKITQPFLTRLKALGLFHINFYKESASYYDHYNTFFGPLPYGLIKIGGSQYGARLIPRDLVAHPNITAAGRTIVEQDAVWVGVGTNVAPFGSNLTNGVNPAWREALVHTAITVPFALKGPWEDNVARQDKLTDVLIPALEAVTPGSGAYVNEANFRQPNFQQDFWGSSYDRLLSIKNKYDPTSLFYATVGVGSEAWEVMEDGRLCPPTN
ncbi:hypothetical protein BX600DRAFT_385991 [Xylariales sp. PMI_506]|nr:hypothetical protein BX600DRAFT_385991 [Xylariales sp. PMI_506]